MSLPKANKPADIIALHAVWRKVFLSQSVLRIPCESYSAAHRLRYRLYMSVAGVKEGKMLVDETLRDAVLNVEISLAKASSVLEVRPRRVPSELVALSAVLGLTPEAPSLPPTGAASLSPEEQAAIARIQATLDAEAPGPMGENTTRVTPYYTRQAESGGKTDPGT